MKIQFIEKEATSPIEYPRLMLYANHPRGNIFLLLSPGEAVIFDRNGKVIRYDTGLDDEIKSWSDFDGEIILKNND